MTQFPQLPEWAHAPEIQAQIHSTINRAFAGKKPDDSGRRLLHVTQGAPGSGKSWFFADQIAKTPLMQRAVFIDPDEAGLEILPGYHADVKSLGMQPAYEKWRVIGQYIAATCIERAFAGGYDVAFGTTGTGDASFAMLDIAKSLGYRILATGVAAPLETCLARAGHPVGATTVQARARFTPEAELREKHVLAYTRLPDFIERCDGFTMWWNPTNGQTPTIAFAASGSKAANSTLPTLTLYSAKGFQPWLDAAVASTGLSAEALFGNRLGLQSIYTPNLLPNEPDPILTQLRSPTVNAVPQQ